jgi:hypothetical protein
MSTAVARASAVQQIDEAISGLTGLPRARARVRWAAILRRLGRDDEALTYCADAVSTFRRAGDRLWQAHALTNRAVLRADRGAHRDLRRAALLYAEMGQPAAVAEVWHNLGRVAARGGDVPRALHWYDRADGCFDDQERPPGMLIDRAEVLLLARLWPEAYEAAAAAARSAAREGLELLLPQARLLQAQAAFGIGDRIGARAAAAAARAAFRRQGRAGPAALADYVMWRTGVSPVAGAPWIAVAADLADRLAAAGWAGPALEVRIHAAEFATGLLDDEPTPDPATTRAVLAGLAAAVATVPRDPARLRARVWYGRAIVRVGEGDRQGAATALAAAVREADADRHAVGTSAPGLASSGSSASLRAPASSAEASAPGRLGVRLAWVDGDAGGVLVWAELSRQARELAERPLAPPTEPGAGEMVRCLARLRSVTALLSTVDIHPGRLAPLRRRQRELEAAVRRATWWVPAPARLDAARRPIEAIRDGLGDRALVELVRIDRVIGAVVVAGDRIELSPLGPADQVVTELELLRFALRRLALGPGAPAPSRESARSLAAARAAAAHAARRLDDLLFAPIRHLVGDRPLVLVPTGDLHRLPWPMLETCRGRTLHVTTSAVRSALLTDDQGHTVLVGAPSPNHAATEVLRIARDCPDATVLTGPRATVADVVTALDGARVAHLAAHGHFRADNPMFSNISMADGPLTGHDLLPLHRPPALLILSACETGLAGVGAGDEPTGFAAMVLGLGTRAVVASVGPVDDEATAALMVDLHRRLNTGIAPADALAAAQTATATDRYASTYGFVCFGAG